MKKILFIMLALLILSSSAFAASLPRVADNAGLLTDREEQKLENRIAEIIDEYACDCVILTAEDTNGKSVATFAEDYYVDNGYGIGSGYDGLLVLISMDERDVYIATCGSAIKTFTDGIDYILDDMAGYLSDGDYYDAFDNCLDNVEMFLKQDANGEAFDTNNKVEKSGSAVGRIIILCVVGLAVGFIAVAIMKKRMNSAVKNDLAGSYVRPGSFVVQQQSDMFLYRTVSRIKKQTQSSSGGGSSTHIGSGGRSFGGGGRKF